ncbi:MAG: alpha/beta hydrolase [Verrucomicrobia bacterium]|nr:alpha/beta hydrolase [Verrucomicrobiota bacterium]
MSVPVPMTSSVESEALGAPPARRSLGRRCLRLALFGVAALALLLGLVAGALWLYFHPPSQRTHGLVYGQRQGRDLTVDVVQPAQPNGLGLALMVSGGWKSGTNAFAPWMTAPLLRRGYTIFAVCHVSQPDATVMEIVADVNRALRFVRHQAPRFGVDPQRLGVTGGSAGGHLSLMLATQGGPGPTDAADPIDRESSAVQAVAIFYPVTDLLNLGESTENLGDGGPPKSFVRAFGPQSTNPSVWQVVGRAMSPIYHVRSNLPPTLIYHGSADTLVPLDQSLRFQAEARQHRARVEVVVRPGKQHGWLTMLWDIRHFADWFDQHLRPERR